jgi:hypothetical protein
MATFDQNLKHVIRVILGHHLTHPTSLALSQSYVTTFDDFRTIDMDDVYEFQYNATPKATPDTKLHLTLVKQVQRCACYAWYKESLNDAESDDPTSWSQATYSKWCRNGYATYLATLSIAAATPLLVTSMTA